MKVFPLIPQPDSMDCGPACLSMISEHYGKRYTLEYLRRNCSIGRDGVSLLGISRAAENIGFKTVGGRITFDKLTEKAVLPCIVHWKQDHFVVMYEIKKSKKNGYDVYVADPGKGRICYSKEKFCEGWISTRTNGEEKGDVLLFEPTPAFYEKEGDAVKKENRLKFLWKYLLKYKRFFTQLILGLFIGSILQLIFPFLTQAIVDTGIQGKDIGFAWLILIAQTMLLFSRTAIDFIRRKILLHISTRINISLISDFFIKLMKLPMKFFDTKLTGDLLQRIEDHRRIENFLTVQTLNLLFSLFSFVIFGIVLFIYNVSIFLVFLAGSILYGLWILVFLKKRRILDYKYFEQQGINRNVVYQLITGMQEIKLQGCEQRKRWEWEDVQADLFDVNMQSLSLQQNQEAGSVLINELKNILITVLAATAVISGNLTLGMMLAIQYIIGQLNSPVEQMMNFIYQWQDVSISLDRMNEIHTQKNEEDENRTVVELSENRSVKIENLCFKYDGARPDYVLNNINLDIPQGKVTAIVGASGSGKTTLIKLLLGYYAPNEGKIEIGKQDLEQFGLAWWRTQCVWAPHNCPECGGLEPIAGTYNTNCKHCGRDLQLYYANYTYDASCRECGSQLQSCGGGDPYNPGYPGGNGMLCCSTHGQMIMAQVDYGYVNNGNNWTAYLSTGKEFASSNMSIVNKEYGEQYLLMDINGDGNADMLHVRNNQVNLFLNKNGIIQSTLAGTATIPSGTKILSANVCDYYSMSHFIAIENAEVNCYKFTRDNSKAHLLTTLTDSYGNRYTNEYSGMTESGNYHATSTYRYYPYFSLIAPLNLLRSSDIYTGNHTPVKRYHYSYYGAVMHRTGLGFGGFEKVVTNEYVEDMTVEETRDPQLFGVTTHVESPYKSVYYFYSQDYFTNKKNNPRMTYTSETDKLTNVSVWANYEYDAYNNPTKVTTNLGSSALQTITAQTYDNLATSARYLIGQPLTKTQTSIREGSSWINKETVTYNVNRLPVSRITYTGTHGTNKTGETQWTYEINGSGNVASEKSAPYYVTEFMGNDYTYDSSGRYVATVTNAMGQVTTYSDYDKYGNARMVKGHKNRTSTHDFDAWGNLKSTLYPDGTMEASLLDWGGQGLYTVTQTATGQPASVVHYDALGRELRTGNQRFDGQWQYVDNAYDSRGRLEKTSLPFKGSSPTHWNSYTYDSYNRPTKLTEASGKSSTWSYSGLSVTETKNGMATTKTTDVSGALISVSDPGGTITYALRPDGQPSSITAPGGVVTSFGYDAYGRQTSIADPSAGTQTFSETYSTAGVRTNTVKDANNKTVTTISAKFGRTTNVNRPEFNTTYTYNSDGLLTNETSTNGTSALFTYDLYDRPETAREIAPDGKYLLKTFAYVNGNISSVQYTSQNGSIGTESFTYANGHNTEIKLDGTTTIWKLTEENALGQPTKATTGTMQRTYSYTAYGMPTGRTAGSLQDFTYNFDVQKGNLLSRKDNKKNITETFGYDNLNRLSTIGTQQIGYAANGNITSMPSVGTLAYENSAKPYQVTMLTPTGTAVPLREQNVSYTSYQRPNTISENGITASFAYNSAGDRVKMDIKQGTTALLTRYYIGGQYELDTQTNTERLYLGGDAYSAPAIYVKEGTTSGKVYYICRDYLGSITHIANSDGSLKQELSYDAWGRLRNPATQVAYTPGTEPALFIGRGYTGHEHLPWFGLVNMNARLYDATLGRFLAPDPYVKNPFLTQDYNRYTYAMNNPLVYIDQDGEFPWLIVGIVAAFTYLKAAHDNTPKADQGNPSKWNWAPWNWGKPEEIQIHIGGNTDGSGMHGGISVGKSGQPQPMVGYNKDKGPGIGYNYNGSSQMYHPGYDYNKAEKATETAIQEAVQTFFSASGVAGSFLENSNATFRITNGAYNGSQISPKIYSSGWKGGSKAKITTYSLSKVGKATSLGSGIITTGYAYNDIINNQNTNPVTYVDAGVGTAGILSSAASYYAGVQIPYVGEAVAIYGTMRLTWDTFFYLGANYGPSKWYGTDDTKWFK